MSTTDEFDPWQFETGLIDACVGTVAKAWFAPDPKMGENYLLHLEIDGEGIEEEIVEKFGVGPKWRSFDGGATVEHPDGEQKRFNQNTQVAKLGMQLLKVGAPMKTKGDPRKAETFVGIRARWERSVIGQNFNDTSKPVTRLWPLEFLGLADGSQGQVAGTSTAVETGDKWAQAPAQAQPAPSNGSTPLDPALAGMSMDDQIMIKAAANQLPHGEWVDHVMDKTRVHEYPEAVVQLADESGLYARLRG